MVTPNFHCGYQKHLLSSQEAWGVNRRDPGNEVGGGGTIGILELRRMNSEFAEQDVGGMMATNV